MKCAFAALWLVSCATTPLVNPAAELEQCSLEQETKCAEYGSMIDGAPPSPAGQLVIGLADRALELPPEVAGDYWRRIEEIVDASEKTNELVNRRAAPAYAHLAEQDRDELLAEQWDGTKLDEGLAATQSVQERLLGRAEFVIRWGSAELQATAARALADGYHKQAELIAQVEIPTELTPVGRASFQKKRDALADELRAEGERVASGVTEHCRKHRLTSAACGRPVQQQRDEGVCGVRVGMSAATLAERRGQPDEVLYPARATCVVNLYGQLRVMVCFDTVRSADLGPDDSCP